MPLQNSEQIGSNKAEMGLADSSKHDIMTIDEYRAEIDDYVSSDEDIKKKIGYLEVFIRNIIRANIKYCIKNPIEKIDE